MIPFLDERIPEQIWDRIQPCPMSGCWLWSRGVNGAGYGMVYSEAKKRVTVAHRFMYENLISRVPRGLVLDHLCRVRCCVNPAHLEPVTIAENTLRGEAPSAINARKDRCDRGHLFTSDNTRIKHGSERICRECCRDENVKYKDRKRLRTLISASVRWLISAHDPNANWSRDVKYGKRRMQQHAIVVDSDGTRSVCGRQPQHGWEASEDAGDQCGKCLEKLSPTTIRRAPRRPRYAP